jgi:hypothetical protein
MDVILRDQKNQQLRKLQQRKKRKLQSRLRRKRNNDGSAGEKILTLEVNPITGFTYFF